MQTSFIGVRTFPELVAEIIISMALVGAAGILDFERSYSESVKDERRPSNASKSIYQPSMLEQTYHKLFMKEGW
jgi:hypothetical protein